MSIRFTHLEQALLRTLAYFDLFDYPLSCNQLYLLNACQNTSESEIIKCLHSNKMSDYIGSSDDYYYFKGRDEIVEKRKCEELYAKKMKDLAYDTARIVRYLPFVRGIYISGDLSKGVANQNSDIDFFIITAHKRVYICKLFLAIFRRLRFPRNYKILCFNYLVSEQHLEMELKNDFIATEVACLVPIYCKELFHRFLEENKWVRRYIPRYELVNNGSYCIEKKPNLLKAILEFPLRASFADVFDLLLRRFWYYFWSFKYKHNQTIKDLLLDGLKTDYNKAHGYDTSSVVMRKFKKRLCDLGVA